MNARLQERVALDVVAGDSRLTGEVRPTHGGFEAVLDDEVLGRPSAYEVAVAEMVRHIRGSLPAVAPTEWSVAVHGGRSTTMAEFAPEGLKALSSNDDECVQRVLSYCPYRTLSDALEAGAQLLTHCLDPSAVAD